MGRPDYEFILVDDYSPDDGATLKELRSLAADYPFVKAISLAKNSAPAFSHPGTAGTQLGISTNCLCGMKNSEKIRF